MRRLAPLLFILLLALAPCPHAEGRSIVIERFDADIAVGADGGAEVTERIQARFVGAWNGLFRTIPVEYRTLQGMNYTLFLDLLGVTDDAGTPLRVEASRERHYKKFKVWVPGARDASRTLLLRYRVRNGLKFFDDHDELYWNVTGDEWPFPILSASARIRLPAGVSGLRAVAFTGVYGAREQAATLDVSAQEVAVQTTRRLKFREGLTVAVGWDPGLVHRPGPAERALLFLRSNWLLGVPILVFLGMFGLWYARGRDPRRRSIVPQYEPPERLTPGELGTLLDNSPDMRDLTATLVDLAVRGYLVIEEEERPALLGLLDQTEYVFVRQKPAKEWAALAPHERALLEALFFGGAERVSLSALKHRFYTHLPHIKDRIFDRLLEKGYYQRRPDRIRGIFVMIGAGLAVFGMVGALGLSNQFGWSPLTAALAVLASAASVIGFGWVMPARTVRGTRVLEQLLGFEEFLTRVEGDRLRRIAKTTELFETLLPYAMAFGVESAWARAFEAVSHRPPAWYRGQDPAGFHPSRFVSRLDRMSTQTGGVMASAPRSSGGSGFSGGGSSGGGMGGGGGGGF